jgi:hypothetical protein
VYGIVSCSFDLKNKIAPEIRQYRRGRNRAEKREQREKETEERKRELY